VFVRAVSIDGRIVKNQRLDDRVGLFQERLNLSVTNGSVSLSSLRG
jgi:hypothetical protein